MNNQILQQPKSLDQQIDQKICKRRSTDANQTEIDSLKLNNLHLTNAVNQLQLQLDLVLAKQAVLK